MAKVLNLIFQSTDVKNDKYQDQSLNMMKLCVRNKFNATQQTVNFIQVGNETPDQLARTGSEPACDISIGLAKKAVRD
jgi:hypothetical protein